MAGIKKIRKGDRVSDLKWNGKFIGTVVRTSTRKGIHKIFVQWDNLTLEDELLASEVEPLAPLKAAIASDSAPISPKPERIQITLDVDVHMGGKRPLGTGCVGYLPDGTRCENLVRIFGQPQAGRSPDGKVQVEWHGRINGLEFTIYDYKSDCPYEQNTDWHIGGRSQVAAAMVVAYFNAANKAV